MKELKTSRKRDAWGTIRGYVYQVELTIQRWLELQRDEVLEMERGEDVDTIQQAMLKHGAEQKRLLEQIKARNQKLSLRSAAALGALASFFEHEHINPGLNLSYRYVTNAKVTLERPSPIRDKTPLVTLWNQLRNDDVTGRSQFAQLRLIRGFLAASAKPKDLNPKTWKLFMSFVKRTNQKKFHAFVRKVYWLANQTPTDMVASQIQGTLVTKYHTDVDQAQTVYSIFFLHVFKLLTQSGIKRLTPHDRDGILAVPHVDERDEALLANLNIHLTDLTARLGVLEEAVALLKPTRLPTPTEILEASRAVTTRMAQVIIDGQTVIRRRSFKDRIDEFLASQTRYCFLLGPSGVGKSISIAIEAERLLTSDRVVLLIPAKYFSLDDAARLVIQELPHSPGTVSWQKLVEIIKGDGNRALLVFIDAIDEAEDLDELSLQLTKLHDSIGDIPVERSKVVLSCRDIAWTRFSQQRLTLLYQDSSPSTRGNRHPSGHSATTVSLGDFSTEELDQALGEIGATELLEPGRFGASPSAHIATVRDLLRHPGTFEHYSALRRSNDALSIQDITWSYLIEERLRTSLEKARRQAGQTSEYFRRMLERLALVAWENNSKTFELSAEIVRSAISEIFDKTYKSDLSPLAALVENRVLNESVVTNQHIIGFHITDIGAYLLSFELDRQIKDKTASELRMAFAQWLEASWNFQPLLDALLALIDRFTDQPYSSRSLAIVEVLVESHRFRQSSIFGLMRPEVLKTIFEIIKRTDVNGFYGYRDAALQVRPSLGVLEEIRTRLKDENPLARQLAAELAGAHQDKIAIDELIQLLQDSNEDVSQRAYQAFGHLGKAAVDPLLRIIRDPSQSIGLRSSCVTALRNVGLRTEEVSAVLKHCFQLGRSSPELLKSSLYAAARLRDRGHDQDAIHALRDDDEWIVEGAAKYLTEVPEPTAFAPLREVIAAQDSNPDEAQKRFWTLNQLMVALWKTDRIKSEPFLLQIIGDALQGKGELLPIRAIQMADKIDLPSLRSLIFNQLVTNLQHSPEGNLVWQSSRSLAPTWQVDHLAALVKENENLGKEGIDTAKVFVDAIVPGIQISEEFPLGNRLNRVSDLTILAKCQAANFAPEATRLFRDTGFLTCMELSRLLWVSGDTRAEDALIDKLENPSEVREARHERSYAVRALGTCSGTKRGAGAVLSYLRNNGDDISYYFHRETLYPLLIRDVITTRQLMQQARDSKAPWASRSVSLLALGITGAPTDKSFFVEIADKTADQPRLQNTAVRMLGFSKTKSVRTDLLRFLTEAEDLNVRGQAAECLAWLNDTSSVHEIERALEDSHEGGFVSALAHFREESSLPILLQRLASSSYEWRHEYLEALGGFWKYPAGRTAILEQFDRWSAPEVAYRDIQRPLIEGLAEYEPDVLLDQFNKSFDDGQLTTSARDTMSLMMARLFNTKTASETLLLEGAKRLLCDQHVPARERMCHALRFASKAFCSKLFHHLHDPPLASEWERCSAVYALGFWNSPIDLIESARFDKELLVRRSADSALAMRLRRQDLLKHLTMYKSGNGRQRLSSYLCLCEQGDQSTIWALHDDKHMSGMCLTFRRHLAEQINKRLANEYKKQQDEEKKLTETRGTVTFD